MDTYLVLCSSGLDSGPDSPFTFITASSMDLDACSGAGLDITVICL